MTNTICVSGGFDPLHGGHVDLIQEAEDFGQVIVILNSDDWLKRKKGYSFMDWNHRKKILRALRYVYDVTWVDDKDNTVCEALQRLRPTYFANGGDRKRENTPELIVCEKLGIIPLFGIGGEKENSSSELVRNVKI